ncbi:AMP-binding protein [Mycolicibacterium sp.]|uniref:AMP-binding protein n=1 Tax=Mycolicibacterium sp. TaxID=2320850 RepID=UPI0028AB4298|nr:AMP-binding protein [Mycolicibacterium sp.]
MSIPELLKRRADERPDQPAYTFYDYEIDPSGFAETLTWSDLYRRVQAVAGQVRLCGSPGDRAAILAPQGLDYIVAFFAVMHAGFIAIPLPVPAPGGLDERVVGALRDSAPVAVLTTSTVVGDVLPYANMPSGGSLPTVIEVDAVDAGNYPQALALEPDPTVSEVAYVQYTSGSTRQPAGVVLTHKNVITNLGQSIGDYSEHFPPGTVDQTTIVSWLPFYHDMGLIVGVLTPLIVRDAAALMTPMAFLQKPSRWIQHLARNNNVFSGAPNFGFELSARRTSDADMDGLDLSGVIGIISGAERVHPGTLHRFNGRFGQFGLPDSAMRSSYGLAEAVVYVVSSPGGQPPTEVRFDSEKLAAGRAELCTTGGTELVGCGAPRSCDVRIVDPETLLEKSAGEVGEVWVHGDQVALGYWHNPELSERTFNGQLTEPSPGTPTGPWLRTGDLGVLYDGELYIIGRIKDLLIIDGRNHYPDDIEFTVSEITAGRVAAVSIPDEATEKLVVIAEVKQPGGSADEAAEKLRDIKRRVLAAVNNVHGVRIGELLLVGQGSLPITTSGKVRRNSSAEQYRLGEFSRLDAP